MVNERDHIVKRERDVTIERRFNFALFITSIVDDKIYFFFLYTSLLSQLVDKLLVYPRYCD